jgi:NTE family protein
MNICFSGGGMKGLAYIGVLRYLEENGTSINRVSGTSIGSLMAMLISLKFTSKELEKLATNIELSYLENIDINLLFSEYGMDNGDKIIRLLNFLVKFKSISVDITFRQLFELSNIHISFTCCSLNNYSQVIFDHLLTPEYSVVLACKHSMAIPIIWSLGKEKYIDGCFVNNIPMEILPIPNSIGFYFLNCNSNKEITDFMSFIEKIVSCSMNKGNNLEKELLEIKGYKLIGIPCFVSGLDTTFENRRAQIESGYNVCVKELKEYNL